ncbi:MAG: hypothetical protein IKJ79_02130 [Bacteroidaceae bacterium]|nr:hypothetical protein [Bacteroidaceae bacterium]
MNYKKNIPEALKRLRTLITHMGYECEVVDKDNLFIFQANIDTDDGDSLCININVTENGENQLIGDGNYIALEVFIPCDVKTREDEMELSYYIMELITHVDLTTIQYVPQTHQILISRVDCISNDISDDFIINHILTPCINEFLYIFYLIENKPPQALIQDEEPPKPCNKRYLN